MLPHYSLNYPGIFIEPVNKKKVMIRKLK